MFYDLFLFLDQTELSDRLAAAFVYSAYSVFCEHAAYSCSRLRIHRREIAARKENTAFGGMLPVSVYVILLFPDQTLIILYDLSLFAGRNALSPEIENDLPAIDMKRADFGTLPAEEAVECQLPEFFRITDIDFIFRKKSALPAAYMAMNAI
jgi:hypothetical protein